MYRTHTCGALRIENVNENVCLSGWVQKIRNLGAMTFIDLRDRYGITQLVAEESASEEIKKQVAQLGREFVIQIQGKVVERASKNNKIPIIVFNFENSGSDLKSNILLIFILDYKNTKIYSYNQLKIN